MLSKLEYFEKQLNRSIDRCKSRPKEPRYVRNYLYTLIAQVRDLKQCNPGISEDDMNVILKSEIAKYSKAVFGSSLVFKEYMEYVCTKYLLANPGKYAEVSESIKNSDTDFEHMSVTHCSSFDDYLALSVYVFKRNAYHHIFGPDKEGSPSDYKNLDELLEKNKRELCESLFDAQYTLPQAADVICSESLSYKAKMSKLREFSSWYKSPIVKKNFMESASVFLNGPSAFLPKYLSDTEVGLRKELSSSIETIVTQLDRLDHLSDYISAYVLQMCNIGFPEFVAPLCANGTLTDEFLNSIHDFNSGRKRATIKSIIEPDKVKNCLSADYLIANKDFSIEGLIALHSFWLNRYAKELDLYSEAMFAMYDFGIVSKIMNENENSRYVLDVSLMELSEMLVKMGTFFLPASKFLSQKSDEAVEQFVKSVEPLETIKPSATQDNLDGKIYFFSYDPFVKNMSNIFDASAYSAYFSSKLPRSQNDIAKDSELYIRLFNPINSSYDLKDLGIKSLVTSFSDTVDADYPNAGVIIDQNNSPENIGTMVGIGIDTKLSAPIRIHVNHYALTSFLKSLNGHCILPVYEGYDDFSSLPSSLVMPLTEKQKNVLKKAIKHLSDYPNPKIISHIAFTDDKHVPEHLKTSKFDERGREKKVFVRRYIDLETGELYTKTANGYEHFISHSTKEKGDSEYEH